MSDTTVPSLCLYLPVRLPPIFCPFALGLSALGDILHVYMTKKRDGLQYVLCNSTLKCLISGIGSGLVSLRLFDCVSISDEGIAAVADSCPLLRELDIGWVAAKLAGTVARDELIKHSFLQLTESIGVQHTKLNFERYRRRPTVDFPVTPRHYQ